MYRVMLVPGLILVLVGAVHAADQDLELAQRWVNAYADACEAHARREAAVKAGNRIATEERLKEVEAALEAREKDIKAGKKRLPGFAPPVEMSPEREREVLETGLRRLTAPQDRLVILKLLVERHTGQALPILTRAVDGEGDPSIRKWVLLLIGLYRDKATAEQIARHLRSDDAGVRAAAADALGVIHRPAYRIPLSRDGIWRGLDNPHVNCGDGIDLTELVAWSLYNGKPPANERSTDEALKQDPIELPEALRGALQEMMLKGATPVEREAAARALIHWPPKDYRLLIAEWGVWLCDQGELQCVQSVLDEIPPFVHRTGNRMDSFRDRVNEIMIITKPVLHVTASAPLAMDLEVQIKYGRPWFAYPRPDDFGLSVGTEYSAGRNGKAFLGPLDDPNLSALDDLGEGYPWLSGRYRCYGSISGGTGARGNEITNLGLHWQSLIVTPEPCGWMRPPDVPADERFRWWRSLRDTPCAWVSSRGEAERFLYYDGPTLAQAPLCVGLLNGNIRAAYTPMFPKSVAASFSVDRQKVPQPQNQDATQDSQRYRGMYVEVREGRATAYVPELPVQSADVPLPRELPLHGQSVLDEWLKLLRASGLTSEEAQALTTCWRKQFFETEGRRFLLILRAADYDEMCPLWVAPKPTSLIRVGVVLTEFGVPSRTPAPDLTAAEKTVLQDALRKLDDEKFDVREEAQTSIFRLGPAVLPSLGVIMRERLSLEVAQRLENVVKALETIGWPQNWMIASEPANTKKEWNRPPIEALNESRYVVDPGVVLGDHWEAATAQTVLEWPFDGPATLWFCAGSEASVLLNDKEVELPKAMPPASCAWRKVPAAIQVPIRRGHNDLTIRISRSWRVDGSFYLRVTPGNPPLSHSPLTVPQSPTPPNE